MFDRVKSIKLSDYFELVKPEYIYLRIIPHKSIRNYNSANIIKAIAHTYRAINKRVYKQQKKIFFETNFKISYVIDIEGNNASFYFIVPKVFQSIIIEKVREIWSKATIEIVDKIKDFNDNTDFYELMYKKEDALSLQVDRKSNEPLNSILSVIDIMKAEDRVTLVYNFIPRSQFGWLEQYQATMDKVRKNKTITKDTMSFEYILKTSLGVVLELLDMVMTVFNDFTGGKPIEQEESLYSSVMKVLERQNELTATTKKKKEATIVNCQIGVASTSLDATRRGNNALTVCQSFRSLDEDNELVYKQCKKFNLEQHNLNITNNVISAEEGSNFIQIPARTLLSYFNIRHINVEENPIPENLTKGTKSLGVATYKGKKINTFLDDEWNSANTALTMAGGQGAGKSTLICNYAKDCIEAREGIIMIDFIKNCELSEDIAALSDSNKVIKLNLADERCVQSFAYNEMKITNDMSDFTKLDKASMQSDQMMNLIDSVSLGDPLSSGMRRVFNSACTIVSVQGYNSLKNVIDCLENHTKRSYYINSLSSTLKELLEDEINTLKEIDEYSKTGELVGTKTSKISFILDRIDILRSNFKLKYMYKANPKNNIDFKKAMDENKIILIQMKEGDFPTKMQKNILVTFFISKIWLATQLRGMEQSKPNRINMIIDEVFQAPTSLALLNDMLVQARKFALKPILSIHYINQVASIFESLQTSNGSFMLMKGCTEQDYNYFKNKIENLEFEDLKDMQKYHSLNLICHSEGYSSFITKLPKPIKG